MTNPYMIKLFRFYDFISQINTTSATSFYFVIKLSISVLRQLKGRAYSKLAILVAAADENTTLFFTIYRCVPKIFAFNFIKPFFKHCDLLFLNNKKHIIKEAI